MTDQDETKADSLRLWFVLEPGEPGQRIVEMRGNRILIGRGEDCDLILDDPAVSRHHAAISVRRGTPPTIEDMGSANGTYVNGQAIRPRIGFASEREHTQRELRGGEWLRLGDSIAIVSLVPPVAPPGEQNESQL